LQSTGHVRIDREQGVSQGNYWATGNTGFVPGFASLPNAVPAVASVSGGNDPRGAIARAA